MTTFASDGHAGRFGLARVGLNKLLLDIAMRVWFLKRGANINGPFPEQKLQSAMKSGKVHADDRFSLQKDGPYLSRSEFITKCLSGATAENLDRQGGGPPPLPSVDHEDDTDSFLGDSSLPHQIGIEQSSVPVRNFPVESPGVYVSQQPTTQVQGVSQQSNASVGFLHQASREINEKENLEQKTGEEKARFAIVAVAVAVLLIPILIFVAMQSGKRLSSLFAGGEETQVPSAGNGIQALKSKLGRKLMSGEKKAMLRSELNSLNTELGNSDVIAKSAFHQQAARAQAAMRAAGVLAQIVGASSSEVSSVISNAQVNEIGAETALQQVAIRLEAQIDLLGLAAKCQGAPANEVSGVKRQLTLSEVSASNVNQQTAARTEAAVKMAKLFAESAGGKTGNTNQVISNLALQEMNATTVYQQIAVRQKAYMKMMEIAAKELGVAESQVDAVLANAAANDALASAVQQQIVARMSGTKDMIVVICESQL